jgi:acyl-[acyl-carrier-protein] desaturase
MEEAPILGRVEEHVNKYLLDNDHIGYNRFTDFDWAGLPDSITNSGMKDLHISAVETSMLVEDHIPGYGSEYLRIFMVHEDRTDEEAWRCRQMTHFVFRWVAEEDRHAHILELYLRNSGRRDPKALTDLMVKECKKHYDAPHDNPNQLFTYTAIQEKATQMFYMCLRQSVEEPTLRQVLGKLSQDEARHCHFFSQLVIDALADASNRHVCEMKDALEHFSMPLAMMMDNYKRKAIMMRHAAGGYDYKGAFEHYARLIKRVMSSRSTARGSNLQDLLTYTQSLMPTR